MLGGVDERLKEKIGFWTRDQNELGELPVVGTYTVDLVRNLPDKTILERAERLLRFAIREQKDLGGTFWLNTPSVIGFTHSRHNEDVYALASLLEEQGWLSQNTGGNAQVTPRGFMHASESNVSESVSGFIAMWFDKSMDSARNEGFEPAIREAGYTPVIVSGVEHQQDRRRDHIADSEGKVCGRRLHRPEAASILKPASRWDSDCLCSGPPTR